MAEEHQYDADDMDHMVQIDTLIATLQATRDQFGNTCVYIRRGGLSWGGVALNRRSDDEEHGVFDLQAQHDRDMTARLEQVERLIDSKNSEQEARWKCEAALAEKDAAMERLHAENVALKKARARAMQYRGGMV